MSGPDPEEGLDRDEGLDRSEGPDPEERDDALVRDIGRRTRHLLARRGAAFWPLMRVIGLGWVLILPTVLGAAVGRLLARWTGSRAVALAGLGLGLAAGAYGVYRQIRLGLAEDDGPRGGVA